jgi:hypothetical protein
MGRRNSTEHWRDARRSVSTGLFAPSMKTSRFDRTEPGADLGRRTDRAILSTFPNAAESGITVATLQRDPVQSPDVEFGTTGIRLCRSRRVALIGALLLGYLFVAVLSVRREWPVLCPFRRITGMRCPLCGVSTTIACLAGGDPVGARNAHPMGALIVKVLGARS